MATALIMVGMVGVLATMGRAVIPVPERLPLRQWGPMDLYTNALRGASVLMSVQFRGRGLWSDGGRSA